MIGLWLSATLPRLEGAAGLRFELVEPCFAPERPTRSLRHAQTPPGVRSAVRISIEEINEPAMAFDQPRPHRVERHVAHRMCEVRLIHPHRAETSLPEMPCPALPRVDIAGVAAMGVGEGAPQTLLVRRHDDDVDVVRHQAIAPDLGSGLVRCRGQEVTVEYVIAVPEEGLAAPVAALRHMIGNSRRDQAWEADPAAALGLFRVISKLAP